MIITTTTTNHSRSPQDSIHNDGERHVPYLMFFPNSTRNKLAVWAGNQVPNPSSEPPNQSFWCPVEPNLTFVQPRALFTLGLIFNLREGMRVAAMPFFFFQFFVQ